MDTRLIETPVSTAEAAHIDANRAAESRDAMFMLKHYDRLHRRIQRRFPKALLAAGIDVDDVVQDTFARAWLALPGFEHRYEGSCYRWLCRIARRHTINLLQRASAQKRGGRLTSQRVELEPAETCRCVMEFIVGAAKSPRSIAGGRETINLVAKLIARLCPAQRQAIQLRYFEGMPLDMVGTAMGKSESAAAMLCFRGLRAIRAWLTDRDVN